MTFTPPEPNPPDTMNKPSRSRRLLDVARRVPVPQLVSATTWGVIVGTGLVVASVVAGVAWRPGLIAMQALLPLLGAAALLAAAIAVARRRAIAASVGCLVAAGAAALVLPVATAASKPPWVEEADRLTIYSANLRRSNGRVAEALEMARRSDADVVVLIEFVEEFDKPLEASGLLDVYPTVVRDRREDGNVLLTRLPSSDAEVVRHAGFELPAARVDVGGRDVFIAGVHTQAPHSRAYVDRWQEHLGGVARAVDGHANVVAIGDFNGSLWNPPMRELAAWGFTDAHDATGSGLARTWGASLPGHEPVVSLIGIDHAMSRGPDIVPISIRDARVPGSDHRSIEVTYAVR